jgi:hypothetical protein
MYRADSSFVAVLLGVALLELQKAISELQQRVSQLDGTIMDRERELASQALKVEALSKTEASQQDRYGFHCDSYAACGTAHVV